MTSINALRFNDYSGIMICDEQRSWNPEDMKVFVSDKIKPVIPQEIIDEMGLVAAYGNTGTSTIGDEIKFTISRRLHEEYRDLKEKNDGKIPENFKTMEDLSELVYSIVTGMKHSHISQQLKALYGFDCNDYMAGTYERNGKNIELKDKEILEDCQKFMTWKGSIPEAKSVFMNAGVLAGYDDTTGFRIFQFSIWRMFKEQVDIAYAAGGSGSDMMQLYLSEFLSEKSPQEKRGNIDPLEGTLTMVKALNMACDRNFGVGGYYNIILFNGKNPKDKRMVEVNDHRARLASEIGMANHNELISFDAARDLTGKLLFEGLPFEEVNDLLFRNCKYEKELLHVLRGYK
jgi:hypothetical protein